MRKKRVLALLMAVTLVGTALMGCGAGDTENNSVENDSAASSEEPYTVVMGYIGDTQPDEALVEAEINKILEPALNARIDLRAFSWGGYQQELQLILSGNEQIDIIPNIINNVSGYVSNGQLVDLTDLIEKYGTNIKEVIDKDFIDCPKIGDFTYGVTTKRENITWESLTMRVDVLEEAGYTVEDNICQEITSIDQLDELFEKVKAANPEKTVLASAANGTPLFRWEVFDNLTDCYGVLMDYGQSTEVVNLYETPEFLAFANKLYEWNQKGYLSKDAATTTEAVGNQVKAGAALSYFTPMKAGAVEQDELITGYDLAASLIMGDPYISSGSVNYMTHGIARNSKNPEKAFQVLDYMYGSSDVMNLLIWGIEGVHYKVLSEETGEITYADGVTADTTGYVLTIGWQLPNQEIAYVWEGETKEKWEKQRQYISEATRSKALGFSYDMSGLTTQLTALNNVKNQYYDAIGSGSINPETVVEEFNQALYAAGLQDVIDAKQEQLDAWLASK